MGATRDKEKSGLVGGSKTGGPSPEDTIGEDTVVSSCKPTVEYGGSTRMNE